MRAPSDPAAADNMTNPRTPAYRGAVVLPLTVRQRQVLYLVAHGETAPTSAALLGISPHTASNLCERARVRLGARTLAEAVYRLLRATRERPPAAPGLKACGKCGVVRPHADYRACRDTRDRLRPWCHACEAAYQRQRRARLRAETGRDRPPPRRKEGAA